ncbi:MAG: PKD domain-containing protein, partial [Methanolinea sp.]|nr:PKD domain-containing protein [Methanolinea sp.]
MQTGWVAVDPATGSQEATLVDSDVSDVNFTNTRLGNVSGFKLNTNKIGQPGWTITLTNKITMVVTNSTVTDSNGYFIMENILPGQYSLNETLQSGWQQVSPSGGYLITVNKDTYYFPNHNFTNGRLGSISGLKFNDVNGNGIREFNDLPLSGWTIQLAYKVNNTLFKSTTTNSSGVFSFANIPQGSYLLKEVLQSGWKQTAPTGGTYTIDITETNYQFNARDFGNQQLVNPCSCPTQAIFTYQALSSPPYTIQFTDTSTGYPVSWLWKFGDGKTSLSQNPTHTYLNYGTYTVTLSVMSYDCNGESRWSHYTKTVSVSATNSAPTHFGIGLWRPSTRMWYLDYDNNGGSDYRVVWGESTDISVTGDWDGDGKDEIGLWRPSTRMWYLDYDNNGGS